MAGTGGAGVSSGTADTTLGDGSAKSATGLAGSWKNDARKPRTVSHGGRSTTW